PMPPVLMPPRTRRPPRRRHWSHPRAHTLRLHRWRPSPDKRRAHGVYSPPATGHHRAHPCLASQQGLALAGPPAGPPGKATGLIRHARLVGETLLPTQRRGIGLLRPGLPVLHRALHAASLPGTLRGRKRAAPVDQRSGRGRILAYRAQRRRGRFAPPHLSSLHAHQLAPWQENTILPPAPHDLVAPTPWSTPPKAELQGMLKLSIGAFPAGPRVSAYQSRPQPLPVAPPPHL